MKNIINIMKYSFKGLRIFYFIELIILIIGVAGSRILEQITGGWDSIALLSTVFTANFIVGIIIFSTQISKDHGRLLFLAPIKGMEFIIGNFLQLVLVNLGVLIISILTLLINTGSINSDIVLMNVIVAGSLMLAYLIITSLIAIFGSYINNTFLVVMAVIFGSMIGNVIYELITSFILSVMPYVYMTIDNIIEIDLISVLFAVLTIVSLQVIAGKHIDKKLDIV